MKNNLMKKENSVIRILEEKEDKVFVIDCIKKTMPKWYDKSVIEGFKKCTGKLLIFLGFPRALGP